MNTQEKENGQAIANSIKADKTPKFMAGNPVNAESAKSKEQGKDETKANGAEDKAGKSKDQAPKLGLNLDQTLKLVADLAKKTALRDRYIGYIDALSAFEKAQKEVDELEDETAFQQCELIITDHKGNVFSTKSPSVIRGTVGFINSRFAERLAEVEAGIVLQA